MAKEATKEKRAVLTPTFRLGFHQLFTPKIKEKTDEKTGKTTEKAEYYAVMIFDKETDFTEMKNLAKKAKKDKWGDKNVPKWKSPFVAGEDRTDDDGNNREEYLGKIVINAKNGFRQPGLRNKGNAVFTKETEQDLYPGCYCVAQVTAYAWTYGGANGVSFGLESIRKVGDGERLTGGDNPDDLYADVKDIDDDGSEDSDDDLEDS